LKKWIDENKKVESTIKKGSPQDFTLSGFKGLIEKPDDLIQCIESLAKGTACAFEFSVSNSELIIALKGSVYGYCQFLNNANDSSLVNVFIPLGVLEILNFEGLSLDACSQALFILKENLRNYSNVHYDKGKALELVLMSSLLLYARSNVKFSPTIF
jgi:hypothetical protein